MKQDPYYKHYIRNTLRQAAEEQDDEVQHFAMPSMMRAEDIYDHVKFDRLNLYDFRRNLPMKEREARIDSKMRAHGYGKRKRSRALARVEPGTGKITINGQPLL